MCLPRVIDRPMPKNSTPNRAFFMRSAKSWSCSTVSPVSATSLRVDRLALDERAQHGDDLEVLGRPDLEEDVGGLGTGGLADVHQDHRPVLAAVGHELALLRQGVLGEMPRMALRRVAAPVDDQVGPVLDFAQRTRNLATQLGGDLGGTVSERGVAVDHAADQLGQGHRLALGLAGDVAEPVHQRHIGLVEEIGRRLDGLIDRGGLAVDQRVGVEPLGGVVLEPAHPEDAGVLWYG